MYNIDRVTRSFQINYPISVGRGTIKIDPKKLDPTKRRKSVRRVRSFIAYTRFVEPGSTAWSRAALEERERKRRNKNFTNLSRVSSTHSWIEFFARRRSARRGEA